MKIKNTQKGFTLIELLVVIAIIGMLSSIVLTSLRSAQGKARDTKRLSDMEQIRLALEMFLDDNGHYPGSSIEGISGSGEQIGDDNGPIEQALSAYLPSLPKDPLHDGSVYFYSYDPVHCTDAVSGSCACDGTAGAVLAFNKAGDAGFKIKRSTCSGGDQNQDNADYNLVLFPASY